MRETGYLGRTQAMDLRSGWFLRWGTYAILFFFLTLLIFSSVFSYNEILKGRVTITSANPPVQVQAKVAGRLSGLNFDVGDEVAKDDVLAVVENPASKGDIDYLKAQLGADRSVLKTMEELRATYPLQLNLGTTIQPFYRNFLALYQQEILDGTLKDDDILREQVQIELTTYKILLHGKGEQVDLAKKNIELVMQDQSRNQRLYEKGVISKRDFETTEKEYNEEQLKMQVLMNEYNDLLVQGQEIIKKETQVKNLISRSTDTKETDLLLARQELINAVNNWEDQYTLKSPIDGKISFLDEWARIYSVSQGEIVFTITPFHKQQLLGKAIVPGENSGKMRPGQQAVFKLDHYPPREWGTVKATVRNFAQMPVKTGEAANLVYLEIPELRTSYGKKLEFNQDLLGSVEILLDEVTLMERVFYQFRHLWSNKEIF